MVELVRRSSETPNITNRDDACLARYAYGDFSGVVKNFGNEFSYEYSNNVFKLNSGRFVLMGWEVDIDEGGHEVQISPSSGTVYYDVYLEINLMSETAEIKHKKGSMFPMGSSGDDLTEFPNGAATTPLYHLTFVNGVLLTALKMFNTLPSLRDIEERLDKLGFKEGSMIVSSSDLFTTPENKVTRQGNYVIGKIVFNSPYGIPLQTGTVSSGQSSELLIGTLSSPEFFPKDDEVLVGCNIYQYEISGSDEADMFETSAYINSSGEVYIRVKNTSSATYKKLDRSIFPNSMMFGYEANPL